MSNWKEEIKGCSWAKDETDTYGLYHFEIQIGKTSKGWYAKLIENDEDKYEKFFSTKKEATEEVKRMKYLW